MSSRDLNVSQFIANLNSLDPMDGSGVAGSHNDEELSIFSNTNFFDFDVGRSTNIAASVDDLLMQQERHLQDPKGKFAQQHAESSSSGASSSNHTSVTSGSEVQMIPLDFSSLQQFSLAGDLNSSPTVDSSEAPANVFQDRYNKSEQPLKHSVKMDDIQPIKRARKNTASSIPSIASASPSPSIGPVDTEDSSPDNKVTAEEDKRRRNTAASARFRIKKKLREQEMERNTKELQTKVQSLENKVMQLEMENRWLKNLVVEKNEARDMSDLLDMKKKILGNDTIKME